jgi:hypothetical protein
MAVGADLVAALVSSTRFIATLVRFELFVAFLDRFGFFVILFPPWNSRTIRVISEKESAN